MWNDILAFETKLRLQDFQINQNNYKHFPTINISKPTTYLHFQLHSDIYKPNFQHDFLTFDPQKLDIDYSVLDVNEKKN